MTDRRWLDRLRRHNLWLLTEPAGRFSFGVAIVAGFVLLWLLA